jgi:hypothetical protein
MLIPSRIGVNCGGRLLWHKLPQILTANIKNGVHAESGIVLYCFRELT